MKLAPGAVLVPFVLGTACLALAVTAPTWRTAMAQAGYYYKVGIMDCIRPTNAPGILVRAWSGSPGVAPIALGTECAVAVADLLNRGFTIESVESVPNSKQQWRFFTRYLFVKRQ